MLSSVYCRHCGNKHEGQDCAVNPTKFEWKYEGQVIQLYGSWSQFQVGYQLSKDKHPPFFQSTQITLSPGIYQYIYNVDGVWMHDPNEYQVSNSYGTFNNQYYLEDNYKSIVMDKRMMFRRSLPNLSILKLEQIFETVRVTIKTFIDCGEVFVKGTWDGWKDSIKLTRKYLKFAKKYVNYAVLNLMPGSYQFKFIIGNQWVYDETLPTVDNSYNSNNNIIHVPKKPANMLPHNYEKVYFAQYQLTHKFERVCGLSMTSIGNELYIFGGRGTGSDYRNDLYVLNPRTKDLRLLFEAKGQPPENRAFHNAIRYGNKIIYFGGLNSDQVFNDYYVFNTISKTWTQSKPKGSVPSPREKSSLTIIYNYQLLVQFGGYYCTQDLEVQTIYNDINCLDLTNMTWTKYDIDPYAPKPSARFAHSATAIKDRVYIFGGQSLPEGHLTPNFNDLWMIDFSQENANWANLVTKGQPPSPRHGHCAVQMSHQIFVFGGRGESSRELMNDIFHLNPETLVWTKPEIQGTVPIPRCYFAAETIHGQELWLLGGHKGNQIALQQQRTHVYVMSFEEIEEDETQCPFSPPFYHVQGRQHTSFIPVMPVAEDNQKIVGAKTK